jgi:hypothetical protein
MENTIFQGQAAATCSLILDSSPSDELIKQVEDSDNVLQVLVSQAN